MDEITLKLQMATQRLTLRVMDAEATRDAALARAERAEAALAAVPVNDIRQAMDDALDECFFSEPVPGWFATIFHWLDSLEPQP